MKKADRIRVFEKYDGRCAYCGCELEKGWHVDHIEPVRRSRRYDRALGKWVPNGMDHPEKDHLDNCNPACASCNLQKHSQPLEAFRNQIGNFINSLNKYHPIYKFAKRYGLITETGKHVQFYFEQFENINNES